MPHPMTPSASFALKIGTAIAAFAALGVSAPARAQEALSGASAPAPAAVPWHFPTTEGLADMVRYLVEDGEAPGVVLGVLEGDGTTRVVAYGSGGVGSPALGPGSVFEIGSITKTFTATLLADMALKGEVALEDPVSKYLPDDLVVPAYDGREITLLDLALHRSGLPTVPDDLGQIGADNSDVTYTVEDSYAFLSGYTLSRAPGARYEYSNFGYGLLGHALGRAAESSYRELVRTRILEPLGMRHTAFGPPAPGAATTGHREGDPVRGRTEIEIFESAGGLRSTAGDLLRYMAAHVGPPDTDLERAMRFATQVRDTTGAGGAGRGMSWGVAVHPGEAPVVAHGGGTVGYSSLLTLMPETGTGMVLLANDAAFSDDLALTLLYPDPPPADWARAAVDSALLARYAGEYRRASGGGSYYIRLEDDGAFTYQPEGKVRARLYATSDSTFYMLRSAWSLTFRNAEDPSVGDDAGDSVARGGAMALVMTVDEREPRMEGERILARKVDEDMPAPILVAGNAGSLTSPAPVVWALVALVGLGGLAALVRGARRRRA